MSLRRFALLLASVMLLGACMSGGSSDTSSDTSSPTEATTSSPSGTTDLRVLDGTDDALDPGTYVIDPAEAPDTAPLPNVEITVPEGWANLEGWGVRSTSEDDRLLSISLWQVQEVYAHPCRWNRPRIVPGPTAADLAEVLTTIPLRNATTPVDIELDGYTGKELEWSVPADADFSKCVDGKFQSWKEWDGDRYQQGPGQVDRLWIFDVDGQRMVIDSFAMPGATAKDRAMLEQVMASISFEDPS